MAEAADVVWRTKKQPAVEVSKSPPGSFFTSTTGLFACRLPVSSPIGYPLPQTQKSICALTLRNRGVSTDVGCSQPPGPGPTFGLNVLL